MGPGNFRKGELGPNVWHKYTACFAVFGSVVLYAQGQDKHKYSLRSPGGIAFSDFRGYEDWSVASSARTEEVLKVIVASPAMIDAYKAGLRETASLFRTAP